MTAALLWEALPAVAKDAYVYTPEVNLLRKITDVRLIDLTNNTVRLVDNKQTENIFGSQEIGYISFSARKPLNADAITLPEVTVNAKGLEVAVSGIANGAQLMLCDVLGRVEQQATAPNATLTASHPGIFILYVSDNKGTHTYKIILK